MTLRPDLSDVDFAVLKADLTSDDFDNGRSPAALQASFEAAAESVIAWADGQVVGTARALSDGVCNAFLVDVWTASSHRRRGIGSAMVNDLLARLDGQDVALFTSEARKFYEQLGFTIEVHGMSRVMGRWLAAAPL